MYTCIQYKHTRHNVETVSRKAPNSTISPPTHSLSRPPLPSSTCPSPPVQPSPALAHTHTRTSLNRRKEAAREDGRAQAGYSHCRAPSACVSCQVARMPALAQQTRERERERERGREMSTTERQQIWCHHRDRHIVADKYCRRIEATNTEADTQRRARTTRPGAALRSSARLPCKQPLLLVAPAHTCHRRKKSAAGEVQQGKCGRLGAAWEARPGKCGRGGAAGGATENTTRDNGKRKAKWSGRGRASDAEVNTR